jgi:hypothetical protein
LSGRDAAQSGVDFRPDSGVRVPNWLRDFAVPA